MPSSRSGDDRWKKLSACDCTICARFMMRRSFSAVSGMRTARIASQALAEAIRWRHRADAADARHQRRHFVERPSFAELFEAAELGHVEVRILHLALVVELNRDLGVPFDAGDGIDDDWFASRSPRLRNGSAYSGPACVPAINSDKRVMNHVASGGHPGTNRSTFTTSCTGSDRGSSRGITCSGIRWFSVAFST